MLIVGMDVNSADGELRKRGREDMKDLGDRRIKRTGERNEGRKKYYKNALPSDHKQCSRGRLGGRGE